MVADILEGAVLNNVTTESSRALESPVPLPLDVETKLLFSDSFPGSDSRLPGTSKDKVGKTGFMERRLYAAVWAAG
jgi:hypothetical protein